MMKVSMLKRTFMSVLTYLLAFVMLLGIVGCVEPAPTTTITLSEMAITIGIGDSKRVQAEVSDDSDVEWTSSNEAVATVSASGVVRGVAAGDATITATANGATATCTVTVQNITVSLDKTELTLDIETEAKKSATLVATVLKDGVAIEEEITWATDNDQVATVDENGTVTAVGMGTATITAKRKGGNATATCAVTVGWENMPAGYAEIGFSEQNKALTNTYGIWNDQGWEFGNTTVYNAYYADSANSQAGKAVIDFEVLSRNAGKETAPTVQVTYRSSTATGDEGAMLDVGYFYTLTLDITSTVAGTVHVNDFAINAEVEGLEEEVYEFELEANVKKTVTVKFAHYDDGRIHETTDYSNVESALHLLIGSLEGRAQVTIDNLQWVKGEQAPERPNTTPSTPAVTVPDLSATDAIALGFSNENIDHGEAVEGSYGTYAVTDNGEGKSYTVAYENAPGGTYENLFASLTDVAGVAEGNMFSVTVTNNGEAAMTIRFDVAGEMAAHGSFADARDCALSSVAVDSEGNSVAVSTDTTYDGTQLTVEAGKTVTVYITYTTEGVNGVPTDLLVYCNTSIYQDTATYSGNVTISEFKFAKVEAKEETPTVEYEEPVAVNATEYVKGDEASSVANAGKFYYWHAEDLSWNCGAVIEVSDVKLEDGAFTFSYKSTGTDPAPAFYGMQVFYKDASHTTGANYKVTLTINSAVAGDITVNGKVVTLVEGENKIEIEYTETAMASLTIQFGTAAAGNFVDNNTITISNLAFAGQKAQSVVNFTASSASLTESEGKVYYNVHGTVSFENCTEEEAKAYLATIGGDLQRNPYAQTGAWDGDGNDWSTTALTAAKVEIVDGTFTISYEITGTANYKYTTHFNGADLKPATAYENTVTVGDKVYKMLVDPTAATADDGARYWGCPGIEITDAPAE